MADVHQRNPRYAVILALVAALVLIGGWLLRPRDIPASPPPAPSESELEQLARRAERRSLEDMTKYFALVAGEAGAALSYIPAAEVTAIVWDTAHLVTGSLPQAGSAGPVAIEIGDVATMGRTDISGPNLPLTSVTLATAYPRSAVVQRATTPPPIGGWVVAVWRTAQAPAFASANFRQSTAATCRMLAVQEIQSSLSLTTSMIGGGLFNMDGHLIGVVLPCGDRVAVVDASSVNDILTRSDTLEQRLLSRRGALFAPLAEAERRYFGDASGLVVREVWSDSSADVAGLWAGDIVTALGGHEVAGLEDLRPLASAAEGPFELRVLRGRRTITLTLALTEAAGTPPSGPGLIVDAAPDAYRIDAVRSDSRAARAGVHAGDRLLRINGAQPRTLQQVRRALTSAGSPPLLLELVRDRRRIAVVLP